MRHGTASFELEPPDEAEMARRMQALLDGGFPYLVAEIGGALAGYAYAGPYRHAAGLSLHASRIRSTSIPARSAAASAARCWTQLIEECERRGFRQMIAVIGDSAQTRVDRLHRARASGMIGTFENVGYKFGRWLDSVLMQRALGAGATHASP